MTTQPVLRGDVAVLVPAAGLGTRLGPGAPKALRTLGGVPILWHAVHRLAAAPSVAAVVVAAPRGQVDPVRALLADAIVTSVRSTSGSVRGAAAGAGDVSGAATAAPGYLSDAPSRLPVPALTRAVVAESARAPAAGGGRCGPALYVVEGGASRQESVAAALAAVPAGLDIVAVHDAARALTPPELVERVAAAVRAGAPAVVPVLPVVDTVRAVDVAGALAGVVDRAGLRRIQTPQGFRRSVLVEAHARSGPAHTDDAGLVEAWGVPVAAVAGAEEAFKITTPYDLALATALLTAAP
ncbi:hypothetical protein GCM10010124_01280 [Pilimelia terevasa]|uniref:2-C-methyl-D-erythritol 4-phosphate cytidylyltransferase n=1 Tax=Pilimelia terevasa TaxID=53372 RepID=A0A8J3FDE3_9ACTN|nr:2-C-methyl-D-erythritol 4-phosphate cytidylyltransferase [Pilimelia terevasa]GGK12510.1 hypothetical protein GCM10010124_01280 [Pilimelia terevasa]